MQDNLFAFVINIRACKLCWLTKPHMTIVKMFVMLAALILLQGLQGCYWTCRAIKSLKWKRFTFLPNWQRRKRSLKANWKTRHRRYHSSCFKIRLFFKAMDCELLTVHCCGVWHHVVQYIVINFLENLAPCFFWLEEWSNLGYHSFLSFAHNSIAIPASSYWVFPLLLLWSLFGHEDVGSSFLWNLGTPLLNNMPPYLLTWELQILYNLLGFM